MDIKTFSKCFYKAGNDTIIRHDGVEHAGYLAFLMILSLFPFLVFFVALTGFVGELEVSQQFIKTVTDILPQDILAALQPRIDEIASGPPQGLLTIAIIGVIWTASSTVEGSRTILNRAYRVGTQPSYLWRRFLSILQFFALTIAIFVAMSAQIFLPIVWMKIQAITGTEHEAIGTFWTYMRYAISGGVMFIVVATSYYVLPNIRQTWRAVAPGSLVVVGLWIIAADMLSGYLHNFNQLSLVYGSLGGIIIALLFFYVVALIYIFGAEFNYHFEKALGHKFIQKERPEESSNSSEND